MSSRAKRLLEEKLLPGNAGKPLWLINPGRWGKVPGVIAPAEYWDELVRSCEGRARFWQISWTGDGAVQGCEYHVWTPRRGFWRRLLGYQSLYQELLSEAAGMVGIEDTLTLEARNTGLKTLILGPGGLDPLKNRNEINSFLASSIR